MQTTTLPIQVSGAAPANAPQRQNSGSDAGEFGATLAREMAQRSAPQQAPKAQQAQPAKPQQQESAKADGAQASTQEPAKSDETSDATAQAADGSDSSKETSDAQAAAAASPAADMLALMASFNQLHKAGPAAAGKDVKDTLQTVTGKADAAQTTLQATLKRLAALEEASASKGKASTDLLDDSQQQTTLGAAAGAVRKDSAGEGIDLRAALADATHGKGQNAADFGSKAREIAAKLEAIAPTAAPLPAQQLQAAAVEAAKPAVAAGEHLSARVGTTAWDNQVGQKIVWMVGSEEQTASLTLNPPDLGPMQVVLSVTGDQASVAFSANHEEVRHALESALPRLREMMGESGIQLGSATVSTGMPDQRQAQGDQGTGNGARNGGSFADGSAGTDAAPKAATRTTVLGDGLVNTFA